MEGNSHWLTIVVLSCSMILPNSDQGKSDLYILLVPLGTNNETKEIGTSLKSIPFISTSLNEVQ